MSSDKRLLLFVFLSASCFLGVQALMVRTGLIKITPPARKAAEVPGADPLAVKKPAEAKPVMPADPFMPPGGIMPEGTPAARAIADADAAPAREPEVPRARPAELVLGAADEDDAASPYHLRLQLDQDDASVARATSTRFDGEFDRRAKNARPGPLTLIQPNPAAPAAPGSLAVFVAPTNRAAMDDDNDAPGAPGRKVELPVSTWEVVRERPDAPAVRPTTKTDQTTRKPVRGQELAFHARLTDPAVELTKVYRIWEGEDGFEVDLKFTAPQKNGKLTYRLVGPHGIPIEGEWYTSSYRDVFFGQVKPNTTEVVTRTAYDAHKYAGDSAQRMTALPLAYAGVEDQYFATFVAPATIPKDDNGRLDAAADSLVIYAKSEDTAKADVTAVIESRPVAVGPNLGEVVHSYRVFAGPKSAAALAPYGAQDLATYRKTWIPIPFAATLATNVIAPLLGKIHRVTESISRSFGGTKGNYGIAIILLTMTVRLIMFPIGRKQAMMAKKMQDLQPALAALKEKYKDDKETITRETMALWRENKVNPAAGCVPALIQMPIFVGLWQSLNNSVELRHSSFLYIKDLAAPDMAFRLPFSVPYIGEYINILPFLVVGLMLIQTKLFSPPPTTPEAEQQQKVMKYMMIVMAFMFYKVPSGLGLYFITSSLWQVCERLLLPKIMKTPTILVEPPPGGGRGPGGNGRGPGGGGPAGDKGPKAPQGWLGKRLEKLLEEAAKNQTVRNDARDRPGLGGNGTGTGNGSSNGDGSRPRSKPPGKRR